MHSNFPGVRRWVAAVAAAASLGLSGAVGAASIYVDTTVDQVAFDGDCSLREAVLNALKDNQSGSADCAAGTGDDEIVLPAGTFKLRGAGGSVSENDPERGDLDIDNALTVRGEGARSTFIHGNNATRLFDVRSGGDLTLRDLALTDGNAGAESGGAIRVAGGGSLQVEDAAVLRSGAGNGTGPQSGGGIRAELGSVVSVERSLFTLNTAVGNNGYGGAIACDGCALTLRNSTLSGNRSDTSAGALWIGALGSATLEYVTVSENFSGAWGGIEVNGALTLYGSLLADNGYTVYPGVSDIDLYCVGGSVTVLASFVERPSGTCTTGDLYDRTDIGAYPEDVLDDLGYFLDTDQTQTQAPFPLFAGLLYDLAAAGSAGCPAGIGQDTDQTGAERLIRGACDAGALEFPNFVLDPSSVVVDEITDGGVLGGTTTFEIRQTKVFATDTWISLTPLQSAGELCTVSTPTSAVGSDPVIAVIPAGSTSVTVTVHAVGDDIGAAGPLYQHTCTVGGTVVLGDAAVDGENIPDLHVDVIDDDSMVPVYSSAPAVDATIDVGRVGEGATGRTLLTITELGRADLTITSATITGADPGLFKLGQTFPWTITDATLNAGQLPVYCSPVISGTYSALLTLNTNDADQPSVQYPLACEGVQRVTLGRGVALEGRNDYLVVPVRLSRPLIAGSLDVVFSTVDSSNVALRATAGVDYVALAGEVVRFERGEMEKTVRVRILDDELTESGERLVLRVDTVGGVAPPYPIAASLTIQDDESVKVDMVLATQSELGGVYVQGELLYPELRITNKGPSQARNITLRGLESDAIEFRYATVELVPVPNDSAAVPTPGVWLPDHFYPRCRVGLDGRSLDCSINELGEGRTVIVKPRLRAAVIADDDGIGHARANLAFLLSVANPEEELGNNELSADYEVRNPIAGGGGGAPGVAVLGVLALLAARRTRQDRL